MKRKRKCSSRSVVNKRMCLDISNGSTLHPTAGLLRHYYNDVCTLRQYLACRLPESSKKKRVRRLLRYGLDLTLEQSAGTKAEIDILDTILVGSHKRVPLTELERIDEDIVIFTQQLTESSGGTSATPGEFKQSDIIDFCIWNLFRRHSGSGRPTHILCNGFSRFPTRAGYSTPKCDAMTGIPGVLSTSENEYAKTLKRHPWTVLPGLLGSDAERVLGDMFLECGLFAKVPDSSNMLQISGVPLSELKILSHRVTSEEEQATPVKHPNRGLSEIRFLRHRILYAKTPVNGAGKVCAGLGRDHVLCRYRNVGDTAENIHLLKYIFPRQFGLHNVFTSVANDKQASDQVKPYGLREQEIARAVYNRKRKHPDKPERIPRRLRGETLLLIQRIRTRHARCRYGGLLEHYCPKRETGSPNATTFEFASSTSQVAAFCRACVSNVFGTKCWGPISNWKRIEANIDLLVRLRRFEMISLHDVMEGFSVSEVEWLMPPNVKPGEKLSKTDFDKRRELLAELLYYLFDSFLIPLIQSHFYVTESGTQRNQLFYFRHDVWRGICEPALDSLRTNMLEQCGVADTRRVVNRRALGVSQVRLLPKEKGMRPIINLRRRQTQLRNGKVMLGRSINSILAPALSVLNYEKTAAAQGLLGSALFSVDDMFQRLQSFRESLTSKGLQDAPLYFAKVDVKACFDSIPQQTVMKLMESVVQEDEYTLNRWARGKLLGDHNEETPGFGARALWKFLTKATAGKKKKGEFADEVQSDSNNGRMRSVYVEGAVKRVEEGRRVLDILREHIECNLIRVGKQIYRQKMGIPQGSRVSTLLCSLFYGEMEKKVFGFVGDGSGHSMLLRLVDDFLLVTTERKIGDAFMRTMHAGIPEYGVEVKIEKSVANFEVAMENAKRVRRLPAETDFPYCGRTINTVSLNLGKDRKRGGNQSKSGDSVTIEYSKLRGQNFYRKTLNVVKMSMHEMLLSTTFNTTERVLANQYHMFVEVAQKSYHYIRRLAADRQPSSKLMIKTVDDAIKLACLLTKRRRKDSNRGIPYECSVSATETKWLACTAFVDVFQRRQTGRQQLLAWLREQLTSKELSRLDRRLRHVVERCSGDVTPR